MSTPLPRRMFLGGGAALAIRPLPPAKLAATNPDRYWTRIRDEQFLLAKDFKFLNNGSLGVLPRPVLTLMQEYLETAAGLRGEIGDYPRWGYEQLVEHRKEMAEYLGCRWEDLAFLHNATEAISTIANGVELKAGDEVLMTDQEHPSGKAGWQIRRDRDGVIIREVALPMPPKSAADLADRMVSAIGPRTKVLFFSGLLTTTGIVMPVREICDAARAKGVITAVDGAHMNGQIAMRIEDLGCDYYAGSPHKWMFAPAGSGILWGRSEMLERLWPAVATGGWDKKENGAGRFMSLGTNNRAVIEGMMAGLRFAKSLGPDSIYERIHALAARTRQMAATREHLGLFTPTDDRMYGCLVSLDLSKLDTSKLYAEAKRRNIWLAGGARLRVSHHVHTRPSDVDALFDLLDQTPRARVPVSA